MLFPGLLFGNHFPLNPTKKLTQTSSFGGLGDGPRKQGRDGFKVQSVLANPSTCWTICRSFQHFQIHNVTFPFDNRTANRVSHPCQLTSFNSLFHLKSPPSPKMSFFAKLITASLSKLPSGDPPSEKNPEPCSLTYKLPITSDILLHCLKKLHI